MLWVSVFDGNVDAISERNWVPTSSKLGVQIFSKIQVLSQSIAIDFLEHQVNADAYFASNFVWCKSSFSLKI